MRVTLFLICCLISNVAFSAEKIVNESARGIPVVYDVDVVVVGGSSAAVGAAVEAAGRGATDFLAAPRP